MFEKPACERRVGAGPKNAFPSKSSRRWTGGRTGDNGGLGAGYLLSRYFLVLFHRIAAHRSVAWQGRAGQGTAGLPIGGERLCGKKNGAWDSERAAGTSHFSSFTLIFPLLFSEARFGCAFAFPCLVLGNRMRGKARDGMGWDWAHSSAKIRTRQVLMSEVISDH
ncbi:hypothetical protein BS50DRAFT_218029 [Corynespora cassiicola Philippines]|uniref:Uncharacterized protein n=1 Tax=Corynespora cassiicola Philippines TaxID=1448308 RepID=A0A2T2N3M6_CORCC|nr:hypothetical protein BS50DRAFT_218029 [Corynespora cassiicola Philippines]